MKPAALPLLTALLLLPLRVVGGDLPVSYLVEEKPLKATRASTPLSFALYTDNTCTTLAQSVSMNVESITILSKLKAITPKKGAKLPSTVELRATLPGVTLAPALYLKVTDSGGAIVPVAGACQAQVSSVQGPQGPPGSALVVRDSVGAKVGLCFPDDSFFNINTVIDIGGGLFGIRVDKNTIAGSVCLAYLTSDCSGDPYIFEYDLSPALRPIPAAVRDGLIYYSSGPASTMAYASAFCGTSCSSLPDTRELSPATAHPLPSFSPPFHIAIQ